MSSLPRQREHLYKPAGRPAKAMMRIFGASAELNSAKN